MRKLILLAMFFSAGSMLLSGAETGIVNLTPRGEDKNSMRACGADLETVKVRDNYNRRYVFKGGEILIGMEFCSNKKAAVSSKQYRIVVPAGEEVVAWINHEGTAGVIEGCINRFKFVTPVPPEENPPSLIPPLPEEVPPPNLPNFNLPPWNPTAIPPPQFVPVHICPRCAAIQSDYLLSELKSDSKPVNVWAVIEGGNLVDGIWKFNGVEVGRGIHFLLDPHKLFHAVHGKPGKYFLQFTGIDSEGHVIVCGLNGTPIELKRHGRNWVLVVLNYIPCVRQAIHPKNWKGWNGVEKVACIAAVGVVTWELWPEAVLVKVAAPVISAAP